MGRMVCGGVSLAGGKPVRGDEGHSGERGLACLSWWQWEVEMWTDFRCKYRRWSQVDLMLEVEKGGMADDSVFQLDKWVDFSAAP